MEVTKPTNSAMTGITLNVLEDFDDIKSRHKIGNSFDFNFFTLDVVGERILLTVSWSGVWELLSRQERDIYSYN